MSEFFIVNNQILFFYLQDEAFALWMETWGNMYPEGSRSREIIQYIYDNYYLVNLVDNEFPKESCLWEIVDRMLGLAEKESDEEQDFENHEVAMAANGIV